MLTNKTRTIILTLAASATFAAGAVAPTASFAKPKGPTAHKISNQEACEILVGLIERELEASKKYEARGEKAEAKLAETRASLYLEVMNDQGCLSATVVKGVRTPEVSAPITKLPPVQALAKR